MKKIRAVNHQVLIEEIKEIIQERKIIYENKIK